MKRILPPLRPPMTGAEVANLQDGLRLLLNQAQILPNDAASRLELANALAGERKAQRYADITQKLVGHFQQERVIHGSGLVDDRTAAVLNDVLGRLGAIVDTVVAGRVLSRTRVGVEGLRVVVVDKGVAGTPDAELATTQTGPGGQFSVSFSDEKLLERKKEHFDLQARVFTAGGELLAASKVRYNAPEVVGLDVYLSEAQADKLTSEYDTVVAAVTRHLPERFALRDLKEEDQRQDISYLANKSGWDARAVALAALADKANADSDQHQSAIAAPYFYALFRAGAPTDLDALFRTDPGAVERIWDRAEKEGLIPKSSDLAEAKKHFRALAAKRLLDSPKVVGVSSFQELLKVSLGDNADAHKKFAAIYTEHRGDWQTFWEKIDEQLGDSAKRLRFDAQLAQLSLNNAPLMTKLNAEVPDAPSPLELNAEVRDAPSPLKLIAKGYYKADKWPPLLNGVPIPDEVAGTPAGKPKLYAEMMASQLRFSFQTAVVAQMVKVGETKLVNDTPSMMKDVHDFLLKHHAEFSIGQQPVEQFARQKKLAIDEPVLAEVTRIQRVRQITPSDEAMNALLAAKVASAVEVVRYDPDEFVNKFQDQVGGEQVARQIHAKARQIHGAVVNLAVAYLTAGVAPGIGVHSPAKIIDASPKGGPPDVIAYPTLEKLFGEMDYCECTHCRSILSPAAYLVDLLQFCDKPELGDKNPLAVLLRRRPDIQHLPLTCENTNTPLPYIDIVNETLEHYVANGLTLDKFQGHNTDENATSEELLANPQYVSEAAYEEALAGRGARPRPLPPTPILPFHLALETVRRYFAKFDAPLPRVMEALRKNDVLERATDAEYGWRDILLEELKISRGEYELLSQSEPPGGPPDVMLTVKKLYGYAAETGDAEVVAEISNAKLLARRLGVSYQELIDVLKTRFLNPDAVLIPKAELLGVSLKQMQDFRSGTLSEADFDKALAPRLDARYYGGDIKTWVRNDDNFNKLLGLITLAVPLPAWVATTAYRLGDCVVPNPRPTGSVPVYECTRAGTSAAAQPAWPDTPGKMVEEVVLDERGEPKGVVWTCRLEGQHNFGQLRLRYADPAKTTQAVSTFEFARLARFVRLWKRLGWTIDQTDTALTALFPPPGNAADDAARLRQLDAGFRTLLPRLGELARVMEALKLTVKKDLPSLLACFAPIGTAGPASLYRQMFLSPAALRQDAAFAEDGYGGVLSDGTKNLADHREALRAAAQLTDDEFTLILGTMGLDPKLTLDNVSALYRHGWLARKLKLSIWELLALKRFTALDPFALPDPVRPPVARLVALVAGLRAAGLKPAALLYAVWNQDATGKAAPPEEAAPTFARGLRLAFAAIDAEFAPADDPDGKIARERMALVYGADAAALYSGIVEGTLVSEVDFLRAETNYQHPQPNLEQAIREVAGTRLEYDHAAHKLKWTGVLTQDKRQAIKAVAGVTPEFSAAIDALFAGIQEALDAALPAGTDGVAKEKLRYDDFNRRLRWAGVMTETIRDALKALAGATDTFKAVVDALYAENQKAITPLFDRFGELKKLYEDVLAPLAPVEDRRKALLERILPALRYRRKAQQALQNASAAAASDVALAAALLADPISFEKFALHAADQAKRPALDDVVGAAAPGLTAQFSFTNAGVATNQPQRDAETNLDYGEEPNKLPESANAGDVLNGTWSGYVEAPENASFHFRIEADVGAEVSFHLDGKAVDLQPDTDGKVHSTIKPIDLRAGTLYALQLTAKKIKAKLAVRWEAAGRGREVIPARFLYSQVRIDRLRQALGRFLKVASLVAALKLTPREVVYLVIHTGAAESWLNDLPTNDDPNDATSAKLCAAFEEMLRFARLKRELSPGDERLLTVLLDPAAKIPGRGKDKPDDLLTTLTRWDPPSLGELLTRFGNANRSALKDLQTFERVHDAFAWLGKVRVSAKVLFGSATNDPAASAVRDLQSALRARHDPADWLNVVKPIHDELRSLRRDALVAYVLHQMRSDDKRNHIDTPDKLFEFFLMDVQMQPCMQTSRIRHALSSVQLFIERCLMNLEPDIAPSSINAGQWAWMKRYRVWEANRKVFLWPENWLEPELRDDQSPFFKEAMSELLQGDITEDRAAEVLLNYLGRLAEVAQLEPCGVYHAANAPDDPSDDVSHVVARTTGGANRKYFYRRRDGGSWTPWEHVKLDIQDNPVLPVVWRSRLFLFWVQVIQQGATPEQPKQTDSNGKDNRPPDRIIESADKEDSLATAKLSDIKSQALRATEATRKAHIHLVLCYSEYINGKWQPMRTSSTERPVPLGMALPGEMKRYEWELEAYQEATGTGKNTMHTLVIRIKTPIGTSAFKLYNAFSQPVHSATVPTPTADIRWFEVAKDANKLTLNYQGGAAPSRDVLTNALPGRVVEPHQRDLTDGWLAPFFYFDNNHVFHVRTATRPIVLTERVPVGPPVKEPPLVIPPIVRPPIIILPDPLDPVAIDRPNFSVDPSPYEIFVTEDVHISRAIGASGTVLYDDKQINVRGTVDAVARRR